MEKISADLTLAIEQSVDLFTAGRYREALPKFKNILVTVQKSGNAKLAVQMYTWIIGCHEHMEEGSQVVRLCKKVESLTRRVAGSDSLEMAVLMMRRANAFRTLHRSDEAREAIHENMRIHKLLNGRGEDYSNGLRILAGISYDEHKFEKALEEILEARSLLPPEDSDILSNALSLHCVILVALNRYQDALLICKEGLALSRRFYGSNHPMYANACMDAAHLYAKLNQMTHAIDLAQQSLAIHTKLKGSSHRTTEKVRHHLASYQKALADPGVKKKLVLTKDRMCNIEGCNKIEDFMDRCMSCGTHYLCKEHKELIDEHVAVCPKFSDVLPEEKKLDTIVKCRRCRKESKLMKCAVCESVWYCGAQCQKDDWKRHKVFCGKKK